MEYRIEKKEAFRVVGVQRELTNDFEENSIKVPQLWKESLENGKLSEIMALMDENNAGAPGVLGLNACNGEEKHVLTEWLPTSGY